MLYFGRGKDNAKLKVYNDLYTFSLPAGHDCPFARECLSKANRETGKIVDGPASRYRCYGASLEAVFTSLRKNNWRNHTLLEMAGWRNKQAMAELIQNSLPKKARYLRLHSVGGDFRTREYLQSWLQVACDNPDCLFYAYTKAISFYLKERADIPTNFRVIASRGGTEDSLIDRHKLVECRVIFAPGEAERLGWPIDHDDKFAMQADQSFCLLVHGSQPSKSGASQAQREMRKRNIKFGYPTNE